jgi:hypothetical protein
MKVSTHETVPYFPRTPHEHSVMIRRSLRGARRRRWVTHIIGMLSALADYPPYGTEPGDWHDFPFYDTSAPRSKGGDYRRERSPA